jgi:hypothetical protein
MQKGAKWWVEDRLLQTVAKILNKIVPKNENRKYRWWENEFAQTAEIKTKGKPRALRKIIKDKKTPFSEGCL